MTNMIKTTDTQHKELVTRLSKSGEKVLIELTPDKADFWHAVTGISTESGELLDAIKKHVIYNKELSRENVIEELGDIEFYLEQARQNLGVTREATLIANINKLEKRYGKIYTDQKAQARADKEIETPSSFTEAMGTPEIMNGDL